MHAARAVAACLLAAVAFASGAQPFRNNWGYLEEVTVVTRTASPFDAKLETTVWRPSHRAGPWPMVILNHGQNTFSDHRRQPRSRPMETVKFFLDRGYLVVAPMRQGFANSTGVYSFSCDHEKYALRYAGDIAAAADHFIKLGEADAGQVLAMGQSNGGMVLLGYAAETPEHKPVARAVINFAGGYNWMNNTCPWQQGMIDAAKALGARTKVPALWLYAVDDHIFPGDFSPRYFAAYNEVHPGSSFVLYPQGGHSMSNTRQGREMWTPDVERFLRQVGLPWQRVGGTATNAGAKGEEGTVRHD